MSKAKHTAWKVKTNVHPETNGDPWVWVYDFERLAIEKGAEG